MYIVLKGEFEVTKWKKSKRRNTNANMEYSANSDYIGQVKKFLGPLKD